MTYDWPLYVIAFLALWSAVVGGVFSAFSEFIMKALMRSAPAAGIEAMQQINKTVIPTQFVAGIFIISIASVALAVFSFDRFDGLARFSLIAAAALYVTSVFLMTLFGNVPMNNRLARLDHTTAEAETYWRQYGRNWTRLNHIRTLGSIATAGVYVFAAITLISTGQV